MLYTITKNSVEWQCPICGHQMTEEQSKGYRGCPTGMHVAQHVRLSRPELMRRLVTKSRVKYVRGDGYKIITPDGTVSPETYYARKGAQDMIDGTFSSHAFEP